MPMFHLLKVLIINALCYENETWNKKRLKVNIMYAYVRARKERVLTWGTTRPYLGATRPRVGICLLPSWGIEPQLGNADAGTRLLII